MNMSRGMAGAGRDKDMYSIPERIKEEVES